MKKKYLTSIFVVACFVPHFVNAEDIYGGIYIVGAEEIKTETLNVMGSVKIENHGTISGNVNVNDGLAMEIKNYGVISGNFSLGNNVNIKQCVTSAENIRNISNVSGHVIEVASENPSVPLNISDIVGIGGNANKIILKDSSFLIDRVGADNGVPIEIQGNSVVFYVDGSIGDFSDALISTTNVNDANKPFVNIINTDGMYDVSSDWVGGKLYVSVVRQTNYSLFMDDGSGDYLDELRRKNPNDKLLAALDSAPDRDTMNRILSESGRTNPIRLMDFSKTLSRMHVYNDDGLFGITARPWYLYSGDFSIYGMDVGVGAKLFDNFTAAFNVFGGRLGFDGKYDEYSAFVYGAKIDALYMDSDWYAKSGIILTSAKFRDLDVRDGALVVQNPSGMNLDFVADGGVVFSVADDISLVPFIGVRIDHTSVLSANETDAFFRLGVNADMKTLVDGNTYDAGLRAFLESDGALYGGIYTNMLSNVDGVGGGVDLGVLYDDMGFSLKISANIKFVF